jgi:peptide/nickel transport system substrate-binding protein
LGLVAACSSPAPAAPTIAPTAAPKPTAAPAATTAPAAAAPATAAPTAAPKPTAAPAATTAPAAAAKPTNMADGQSVVYGLDFEPSGWDPHVNQAFNAHRMIMNVFDTLVFQTADGKFYPGLATSWDVAPDGKTYTFKLRTDVKFHDGTPFNADAVVFSFNRIMSPDTKSQLAASLLGPFEGASAVDASTVKVTFKAPYPAFLDSLSYAWTAPVSPAAVQKYGADFGRNLVGTGPFRQKEWVPKERYVIERNPDYNWAPSFFKHQGPAYISDITFRFVGDLSTREAAVENGELTAAMAIEATDLARLKANTQLTTYATVTPGAPKSLYLNMSKEPFTDLKVRQAVLKAVDKKSLNSTLQANVYTPAYGPLSRVSAGYDKSVESGYDYDLEGAKKMLDAAGWTASADGTRTKSGQALQLKWVSLPTNRDPDMAQFLQAMLKGVGIDMPIEVSPAFPQETAVIKANEYHIIPSWWVQSDPTLLTQLYATKNIGVNNWSKSGLPELDTLLDQMDTEPDRTKRLAMTAQAQKMVMDNALTVPLWDYADLVVTRAALQGLVFNAAGQYSWFYDAYLAK